MSDEGRVPGESRWDEGFRAAFEGRPGRGEPPPRSILDDIEDATGASARVLLRDDPGEHSPLLRVGPAGDETAADDSRFRVVGEIGRGGVGIVYKARDVDLGRDVALKVLRRELADSPEIVQRFVEEAQVGGQLQHPGVVPVYGLGLQPDGRPHFAMKLVKGKTLAALLVERADSSEDRRRFLSAFEQVSLTLAYAHARGVLHRDLKPSNILLGAFGETLVVDWGFAKVMGRDDDEPAPATTVIATVRTGEGSSASMAGSVMGTPAYMPPEQALGQVEDLDERSDVFALGSILCEILTGGPAYVGDRKDLLVMAQHARLDGALERLDACGADATLVDLARRCLSPLRGDRPRDASVVAEEISRHLADAEERARRAEVNAIEERSRLARERQKAIWERRARRRTRLVAACVLVAVLLGGSAFLWREKAKAGRAERTAAEVARAMERAELLRGQAMWAEAADAARVAVELARTGEATAETRGEAEGLLAAVENERQRTEETARRAARDEALVAELEAIRLRHGESFRGLATDEAFRDAFRKYGIDVDAMAHDEAGRIIASSTRPTEVAIALDWWAWLRGRPDLRELGRKGLLDIARVADPDPSRNRLRDALEERTSGALVELARTEAVEALGVDTLDILGLSLFKAGEADLGIKVLQRAHDLRPDSFWVNYHLAWCLKIAAPKGEAAPYAAAAVAARPGAPAWTKLGEVYVDARQVAHAIEAAREALRHDPSYPAAVSLLGTLVLRRGEYEEALDLSLRAVELDPESSEIRLERAGVLSAVRRFAEALEECREAVRLEPDHARGHYALGDALVAARMRGLGRFDEAMVAYEEALRLARFDFVRSIVHNNRANALREWGKREPALADYRNAVELDPSSALTRTNLASVLIDLERLDDAHEQLDEALRIDPGYVNAHLILGAFHAHGGNLAEAERSYRRALAIDPWCSVAHVNLADLRREQGRLAEFEEHLREAIRRDRYQIVAHVRLTMLLTQQRRWAAARGICRDVASLDLPTVGAGLYCMLASARWRAGDRAQTIALLREAGAAIPDQVRIHADLGRYLAAERRWREAIEAYREAVRRNEKAHPAVNQLAWLLADCEDESLRKPDEAVTLARSATELDPDNGDYWNTLGVAHFRAGNFEAARKALRKASDLNENRNPTDALFLAMVRCRLGEADAARKDYERALRLMKEIPIAVDGDPIRAPLPAEHLRKERERHRGEAAALLGLETEGR